jgi:exodeoxyribonuclease VII large subunit
MLEMQVGKIAVSGEISNFSKASSGHWYFTLKDSNAQIRCAMFKNKNLFLRMKPVDGMQVIVHGNVSIYEGRGEYQLIADYIEESGIGSLHRQFEKLKSKLASEGLFDSKYKTGMPKYPQHIGVITSLNGAAIHDILTVLNQRFPLIRITIIPVTVQGPDAAEEICRGIMLAERWNSENTDSIDLIIVGRGGGSIEDLWSFNEESVARAIFACKIPVVSAVGHEVDITIADYVADIRAPTPSAAAEMISPDQFDLRQQLDYFGQQLCNHIKFLLEKNIQELAVLQKSLKHPGEKLAFYHTRFKHLQRELARSQQQCIHQAKLKMLLLSQNFLQKSPSQLISMSQKMVLTKNTELHKSMCGNMQQLRIHLQQQAALLNMVSPLSTLERGYAIVRNNDNDIIRSIKNYKAGDRITATLADGKLDCTINNINP